MESKVKPLKNKKSQHKTNIKIESKSKNKGKILSNKALQKLSLSIGDFIRYWGFRRIHGAVWTQLYLSQKALSCSELTRNLGLSKALISPALDELLNYKLISEVPAPNEKTKIYKAVENVNDVILHILESRESKMLEQILQNFNHFKSHQIDESEFSLKRVEALEGMILSANMMLQIMLTQKNLMSLPQGFNE